MRTALIASLFILLGHISLKRYVPDLRARIEHWSLLAPSAMYVGFFLGVGGLTAIATLAVNYVA